MQITINNTLCTTLEQVQEAASPHLYGFVEQFYNEEEYIIVHTSGSTGKPKKIKLFKDDMIASARLTNQFFGINSQSLFYLPLSPDYVAGKMMILRALIATASIIEEAASNTPLAHYTRGEIDLICVVPSQVEYILNNPDKAKLIRKMIIGGGTIHNNLWERIADSPIKSYATYGMTETCSHVALARITDDRQPFMAIGETTFELDERNCLIVNTPQFRNEQITTNDIVELVGPTAFYWCGRYDNIINTGGIKIFPEDIEFKISPLIPQPFYISSRESEKWGEELVLMLEEPTIEDEDEQIVSEISEQLLTELKKLLPSYAIPRTTIQVKAFKRTPSNKLRRTKPEY